ncbi:hypothetical protein T01_7395 [Trichinella spiralis]|uniref:Uncharacterized protein n=1 Tax=Trichinella spiralis TaxID=6334 RepID=A0A0V0YZY0_TRISP|nr:hypothetical protein T01_7395 [Trichinella spiralis]
MERSVGGEENMERSVGGEENMERSPQASLRA